METSLCSLIDALLRRHSPADHPLFSLLRADALAPHEVEAIALEVFHVTAAFPRFLAAVAARIEDNERRAPWVENLSCEQGGSDSRHAHVHSYRRFLHDLSIPHAAIDQSQSGLAALCYCRALYDLCSAQPLPEARAALSMIEDIVARVSPVLVGYARLRSGDARAGGHFAMHAELDRDHAAMSYAESERDLSTARAGVERGLVLGLHHQWQLYSQLVEQHVAPEKWQASWPALKTPCLRIELKPEKRPNP